MKNIIEVYCLIDNFVKFIHSKDPEKKVGRKRALSITDYVILTLFKQEHNFRTTKDLYNFVREYMSSYFPPVPSYQQFNEGINATFRYLVIISWLMSKHTRSKGAMYHVIDSTPMPVCNNQYRFSEKIFKGLAASGKNLNGWFWGFKLHLIINQNMEIESIKITNGSASDTSVLTDDFIDGIKGWLVGDKGYIGVDKAKDLSKKGIKLLTRTRKNMKKKPATSLHNYLFSKRQSIEGVFSYLKHRLFLINSYARSAEGFFVSVFSAIISYSLNRKDKSMLSISTFLA